MGKLSSPMRTKNWTLQTYFILQFEKDNIMFDVHALNFIKSSLRLPNFLEGKTDGNIWILFACFFQLCMCVCLFFFWQNLTNEGAKWKHCQKSAPGFRLKLTKELIPFQLDAGQRVRLPQLVIPVKSARAQRQNYTRCPIKQDWWYTAWDGKRIIWNRRAMQSMPLLLSGDSWRRSHVLFPNSFLSSLTVWSTLCLTLFCFGL